MAVTVIEAESLGGAWLETSRAILERGGDAAYDGQPTKELALLTLVVERPASADSVVAELAAPVGRLVIHAKSAHVYEPELELMAGLAGRGASTWRGSPEPAA